MRIDYKIFWVEDNNDWFKDAKKDFKETLEDWGFKLKVLRFEDFQEVKNTIDQDGLKDFDLFLVDLKLKDNEKEYGDHVISFIRSKEVYTDIIFYSTDTEKIDEIMKSHMLEGVYISGRDLLGIKFEKVVRTTIKKIEEVNTIRGLLMAETSDLDKMMLDIILKALKNDNGYIKKYAVEKMKETISNNQKTLNSVKKAIAEKVKDGRIFTSFHKAKVINKICSVRNLKVEKFFEGYNEDILKNRNIYAHKKEEEINVKKVNETGREIRKKLAKYKSILEGIKREMESSIGSLRKM